MRTWPLVNVGSISPSRVAPCKGVELGGVRHARRGGKIVVGAERDDQEIRLVGSAIGRDALGDGIDR